MPRKKTSLGRSTKDAKRKKEARAKNPVGVWPSKTQNLFTLS